MRVPDAAEVWTPPMLALAVGAFAIGLPDPVLVLPLCWGVAWMRPPVRMGASVLGLAALVAASVRAGLLFGTPELA